MRRWRNSLPKPGIPRDIAPVKRPTRTPARWLSCAAWGACLLLTPQLGNGQSPKKSAPATGTNAAAARIRRSTFPYMRGNVLVARVGWEEERAISLTVFEVKEFRCETFNPDGTPNLLLEAPTCLFNLSTTNASSSGPLTVTQAGDGFSLTGEGFNWNHASQRLQISNHVHAIFRLKAPATLLPKSP